MCQRCEDLAREYLGHIPEEDRYDYLFSNTCFPFGTPEQLEEQLIELTKERNMCGETRQEKIVRLERELAEAKGETFLEIGQRVTMSGVIQGIDEDDSIYTYKVALDGAQPGEAFWFPKSALKLEASTPADQSGLLKVGTRVKVGYNSRTEVGVIVNVDMEDDIVPYRIQFDGDNYPMWVSSSRIIEVIE